MDDFNNNQDNMNDNYNQNYGQNNGGEYFCSYTPSNNSNNSKRACRYIFIAVMSVTIVALMVFSGVLIASLAARMYLQGNQHKVFEIEAGEHELNDKEVSRYAQDTVDLGISVEDVTPQNLSEYYHRYKVSETGVIVVESRYMDELMVGDMIISVNGIEVCVSTDIPSALEECSVGDTIKVIVVRNGLQLTVDVTLHDQTPEHISLG